MITTSDVRLFAYEQGPWRGRLDRHPRIDHTVPTTAAVPPAAARGTDGRLLPYGTHRLLAGARYPQLPALPAGAAGAAGAAGERLGHLLVAAVGLQRREPSNLFNDHRAVASVRSMFPVHLFVVAPDGSTGYLDLYRHALVDLPVRVAPDGDLAGLLPAAGDVTVLLAARYTDLPTGYGELRCTLGLLELGVNLRALHVAADLLDVRVRLRLDGTDTSAAGRLVAGSGPGAWSPPLVMTLEGVGPVPPSAPLPGGTRSTPPPDADGYRQEDVRLAQDSADASLRKAASVTASLTELACPAAEPVPGVPELQVRDAAGAQPSWAGTLWNRSAGRVPAVVSGFSARPAVLGEDCLADMLAWLNQPAPEPLAEVGSRVRTTVALQRMAGLPTGRYSVVAGELEPEQADAGLMQELQDGFSYALTPAIDCGLRHANAMWVFSADIDGILAEFGPAGWPLLQMWCGWSAHGLSTAAAGHGLFARPARSFDEFRLQHVMGLPRHVLPVFSVTCGRSRFAEPMLDLRT